MRHDHEIDVGPILALDLDHGHSNRIAGGLSDNRSRAHRGVLQVSSVVKNIAERAADTIRGDPRVEFGFRER